MMQKLQKFGAAMFVPVLLFSFAGLVVALGSLFTNAMIFPHLAQEGTLWYGIWYIISEGGWTVLREVPLLFVIGLPIGLAKKSQGRAALESFVTYMTFNYFVGGFLSQFGSFFGVTNYNKPLVENSTNGGLTEIAGIKTLDTSIIGALIVAGIVVWLHNRYFDKKLPEWLGTFQGSAYVVILGFVAMFFLAFITCLVWPKIQMGIASMQGFLKNSGVFGVWLYGFLQRVLIPTGLHHFVYIPFQYGPAVVSGGLQAWWLKNLTTFAATKESLKTIAPAMGFELFGNEKVFGVPAIACAFYATAKKAKKKETASLLIPAGLTSLFAGITEPVEFTFLFAAPALWFVHSFLAATMQAVMFSFGVVGQLDGGLIGDAGQVWIPLWHNHWQTWVTQIVIGLIFSLIYFFVFKFLIEKYNLMTPGREEDDQNVELLKKKDYKAKKAAEENGLDPNDPYIQRASDYIEELGGASNIEDITSCATRLRVTVKDDKKVASDSEFRASKATSVVRHGNAIQVIVGLDVAQVLEKIQDLLENSEVSITSEAEVNDSDDPYHQSAQFILDSLGTSTNVKNIENTADGLNVTVADPSQVDSEEIFISLDLGISQVIMDGNSVQIKIEQHDNYFESIKSML
ncbi:MAG TPA: alpha-glucoside-specific PTS transporter subunit IIBC [Candidatus Ligilactobacillus excrementavium]|nr:alpha-glucoside-specific PTS transporter subunit IIBC [Candidatus Ligilactobacillus excrementavium]